MDYKLGRVPKRGETQGTGGDGHANMGGGKGDSNDFWGKRRNLVQRMGD